MQQILTAAQKAPNSMLANCKMARCPMAQPDFDLPIYNSKNESVPIYQYIFLALQPAHIADFKYPLQAVSPLVLLGVSIRIPLLRKHT